jgi:hypothetical protein
VQSANRAVARPPLAPLETNPTSPLTKVPKTTLCPHPPNPPPQERWLEKDCTHVEGASDADGLNRARRFIPFGTGKKDCIGQALAMVQVRAMLAMLLSRYWIGLDPAKGTADEVQDQIRASLTFFFEKGLHLTFEEHSAARVMVEMRAGSSTTSAGGSSDEDPGTPGVRSTLGTQASESGT